MIGLGDAILAVFIGSLLAHLVLLILTGKVDTLVSGVRSLFGMPTGKEAYLDISDQAGSQDVDMGQVASTQWNPNSARRSYS